MFWIHKEHPFSLICKQIRGRYLCSDSTYSFKTEYDF